MIAQNLGERLSHESEILNREENAEEARLAIERAYEAEKQTIIPERTAKNTFDGKSAQSTSEKETSEQPQYDESHSRINDSPTSTALVDNDKTKDTKSDMLTHDVGEDIYEGIVNEPTTRDNGLVNNTELVENPFDFFDAMQTEAEPEFAYNAEVLETYQTLLSLTSESSEGSSKDNYEEEFGIASELEDTDEKEIVDSTARFEEFIMENSETIELEGLENIMEQADTQPLEKTFTQLAMFLSESPDYKEKLDQNEPLKEALEDLAQTLTDCYIENEDGTVILRMTPEMTEKLLTFVRALGVKTPEDELVKFASDHDVELLLQAAKYFSRFVSDDQQESMQPTIKRASSADNKDTILRLSKIIFALIAGKQLTPAKPM